MDWDDEEGIWYFDLVPEATQRLIDKYLPIPQLIAGLRNAGFRYGGSIVPIDATLQGKAHFDVDGPFKPEWRAGISVWPLATKEELEMGLERLRRMKNDGTFEDYFRKRDALRRDLGQMTFIYATK